MARIFRLTLDLHEPGTVNPFHCVEVFEQVRTAPRNRVFHFGYASPVGREDISWIQDFVDLELEKLVGRTIGIAEKLPF
jgi:hypothetical protein